MDLEAGGGSSAAAAGGSKKLSQLAKALLRKKPVFDGAERTFEEYFDEYYQLDCEDVIGGDLACRFKYYYYYYYYYSINQIDMCRISLNQILRNESQENHF